MKNIDWKNLPFGYLDTDYNIRCYYKNGKWGELEISSAKHVDIHIAATCLHYGQECFEGLKAFNCKDGKIRIFRWEDNAKRMLTSSQGIMLAEMPVELFGEAIKKAVRLNVDYVPPYGSGAALYIRPIIVGTGPEIGVKPAIEYMFLVLVTPVGPYFKEGFNPVSMMISRKYDRTAPNGTGYIKVGGNYAASLVSMNVAHKKGYANVLFLDPAEKKYIDECGPANFFGIKNNTYITPLSKSILPSITNKSLMTLAEDIGMKVERRPVPVEELSTFDEVGACGTAAIISPIKLIFDDDTGKAYEYCKDGKAGPISSKLYNKLRAIQYGDEPDVHKWVTVLEM